MCIHLHVHLGMSESSGPQTVCKMAANRWVAGSAGKDIAGVYTKIDQPDAEGEGEVRFFTCSACALNNII